jgi:hypothetical protein
MYSKICPILLVGRGGGGDFIIGRCHLGGKEYERELEKEKIIWRKKD